MKPPIRAARLHALGPPQAETSSTRTATGAVVCRLTGDVDGDSAPAASQTLLSALNQVQRPGELFVDLAGVQYFSAAGLTALLTLREAAATARVPLILIAPSPLVRRVLQLTDTRQLFAIASRLQPVPEPG